MSVEQFTIPHNTIENPETEASEERLDYQLSEEQKRFIARQALNLLT